MNPAGVPYGHPQFKKVVNRHYVPPQGVAYVANSISTPMVVPMGVPVGVPMGVPMRVPMGAAMIPTSTGPVFVPTGRWSQEDNVATMLRPIPAPVPAPYGYRAVYSPY